MDDSHFHLVLTARLKKDLEAIALAKGLTLSEVIIESLLKTSSERQSTVVRSDGWQVSTSYFHLDGVAA